MNKDLKEQSNRAFLGWFLGGAHEADDDLNGANINIIQSYMAKDTNAIGYKWHEGIIELNEEDICNFCCDYIFSGTSENFEKVKNAELEFLKKGVIENLINVLENADGICLIWS